jgi:hypothetical protein
VLKILNAIGSLFVYRSPKPKEGFLSFFQYLPTRQLKLLTESNSHYSKKQFAQLYALKNFQ